MGGRSDEKHLSLIDSGGKATDEEAGDHDPGAPLGAESNVRRSQGNFSNLVERHSSGILVLDEKGKIRVTIQHR